MEIQIPSPSVFLRKSPVVASAVPPLPSTTAAATKSPVKQRGSTKKSTPQNAVNKTKQTKSRNGCGTCKKKRLKCDETKPSCTQCSKRNVTCEGYKKEYKWRDFKDTTFNVKSVSSGGKKAAARTDKWLPVTDSLQDTVDATSIIVESSDALPDDLFDTALPDLDFDTSKLDIPSPRPNFTPDISSGPSANDHVSIGSSILSASPNASDASLPVPDCDPIQNVNHSAQADEEVVRDLHWKNGPSSPAPSQASISSNITALTLLTSPQLDMASPEMLLARFDQFTCGILSVKDGPTENPWRTLIWPLAQDSQALYHAISSMTAFHGAYGVPQLRVAGMAHMTKSIRSLAADIENMRLDAALATSLSLALAEGWDEKISTGIQHLRGAKIMVNNALVKHRSDLQNGQLMPQDAVRLKFLCNTFIYLDVIARLTSDDETPQLSFDDILMNISTQSSDLFEVDPLMGCATTMFPLIGQVASLIQRIRKTQSNSLNVVSQAMDLKQKLVHWEPPQHFLVERPEDPFTEVQHAIQTAEAYRFATLLYLHQAVPEIPSESADVLAKKVLLLLASVPLSSRTIIVQIFPLFAASCEVTTDEDRSWVLDRWAAMISRLHIGNVDSCWNVVQEVWRRRDDFEAEKQHRLMRRYTSRGLSTGSMIPEMPVLTRRVTASDVPFDQMDFEYTVRGSLHWIGVMSEWNWEVFLG